MAIKKIGIDTAPDKNKGPFDKYDKTRVSVHDCRRMLELAETDKQMAKMILRAFAYFALVDTIPKKGDK